jgi:hypothetical protein
VAVVAVQIVTYLFAHNVIHGVSGTAIAINSANTSKAFILHNTIDGGGGHAGTGAIGIGIGNNSGYVNCPKIVGNMLTNWDDAIHCAYTTNELPYFSLCNAFYGNTRNFGYGTTTASTIWGPLALFTRTEIADPYTARASANYRLLSTAVGAGAGPRPYVDVGALMRAAVAGGGILRANMSGGILA